MTSRKTQHAQLINVLERICQELTRANVLAEVQFKAALRAEDRAADPVLTREEALEAQYNAIQSMLDVNREQPAGPEGLTRVTHADKAEIERE